MSLSILNTGTMGGVIKNNFMKMEKVYKTGIDMIEKLDGLIIDLEYIERLLEGGEMGTRHPQTIDPPTTTTKKTENIL